MGASAKEKPPSRSNLKGLNIVSTGVVAVGLGYLLLGVVLSVWQRNVISTWPTTAFTAAFVVAGISAIMFSSWAGLRLSWRWVSGLVFHTATASIGLGMIVFNLTCCGSIHSGVYLGFPFAVLGVAGILYLTSSTAQRYFLRSRAPV